MPRLRQRQGSPSRSPSRSRSASPSSSRAGSRSRSSSLLSSGVESAYEPPEDDDEEDDHRSAPPTSPPVSGSDASEDEDEDGVENAKGKNGKRSKNKATDKPEGAPQTRADFTRFTNLVSSIASRDKDELALRLAGAGVWSPQFWGEISAGTAGPSRLRETRKAYTLDMLDDHDDNNTTTTRLSSHAAATARAKRIRKEQSDPVTRWPLHPTQLDADLEWRPILPMLREVGARIVRADHLTLAKDAGKTVRRITAVNRRLQEIDGAKAKRPAVPLRKPEADLTPAALDPDADADIVEEADADLDLAAQDANAEAEAAEEEAVPIPTVTLERVAANMDKTLATLAAFRAKNAPNGRAGQRPVGFLDWQSVLDAGALCLDRRIVARAEARLKKIMGKAKDEDIGDDNSAAAPSADDSKERGWKRRLDLVNAPVNTTGHSERLGAVDMFRTLYEYPTHRAPPAELAAKVAADQAAQAKLAEKRAKSQEKNQGKAQRKAARQLRRHALLAAKRQRAAARAVHKTEKAARKVVRDQRRAEKVVRDQRRAEEAAREAREEEQKEDKRINKSIGDDEHAVRWRALAAQMEADELAAVATLAAAAAFAEQ